MTKLKELISRIEKRLDLKILWGSIILMDLPPEERSKRVLTGMVLLATIPTLLFFSVISFFTNQYFLASLLLFTSFSLAFSSNLARKIPNIEHLYRINLAIVGLLFLYLIGTSGINPRRILWAYIFPIEVFYLLGRKDGALFSAIYYILAVILVCLQDVFFGNIPFGSLFILEFCISLFIVTLISYFFETVRTKYHEGMEKRQISLEEEKKKLSQINKLLEQEVEDRKTAEKALKDTLQDLKETQAKLIQSGKLASIGELAAGVAHELNQPLMVIRSDTQLLERYLKKENQLNDLAESHFGLVNRNTKRMMKTINHLKTFTRSSINKNIKLDLDNIIRDSLIMMGEQLRVRDIAVRQHIDKDLPLIIGDPNQLEQVFLNLFTNARDAIEERRKKREMADHGLIEINATVSGDKRENLIITVRDNGSGIDNEYKDNIFDPFFTTKEVGQGTGLGLSITYQIIKDHEGTIGVLETGPEGTIFRIILSAYPK